jgi:hypothetical protein
MQVGFLGAVQLVALATAPRKRTFMADRATMKDAISATTRAMNSAVIDEDEVKRSMRPPKWRLKVHKTRPKRGVHERPSFVSSCLSSTCLFQRLALVGERIQPPRWREPHTQPIEIKKVT